MYPKLCLLLLFMKNTFFSFGLALLFVSKGYAQSAAATRINWISIEEAYKQTKTQPRKILVDVYTDWCGWCKKMDATTFSNPQVIAYINANYYAVKLDAEGTKDIKIDKTYKAHTEKGRKATHDIAVALLQGKLSYPSTVYLNEKFEAITVVPGYFATKDIEPVLAYFTTNKYLTQKYDEFTSTFKAQWK